ncbi:MAG TPA: hypothetical protein VKX16_06660 [Chloroflexota bacterium]|nr:hypothetical protein [Chloroflexota bacterium]
MELADRALDNRLNREVHGVRGVVLLRRGRRDEAEDELQRAVVATRAMGYRLAEGRSLHLAGVFHAEAGEVAVARMRFEAALGLFNEIGAHGYTGRTERALAAL